MALLTIKNLQKSYGSNTVLAFSELEIGNGISWIKGGNGKGKTTLFKIIAGQIPFQGSVELDGISLRKSPQTYRKVISYAEAEPQYPPFITGRELLRYYQKIRKVSTSSSDQLIEMFEMAPFMDNKIEGYSSGMLKKLSLICAFTGDVSLYLLDEPFITIDSVAASALNAHINQLHQNNKIILISSHQELDLTEVTLTNTHVINDKKLHLC